MLLFYPGGVKNLARNYPNLGAAIDGHFDKGGISQGHSAVMVAASVIANEFEALSPGDRDAIWRQLVALHSDFDRLGPAVRLAPAGVSDQ